ncbi:F0F1 ATP synthase subunit B [Candidatus Saccharibacteria bacterium]|nr:F0F1 ATP synthase subunit B [Candidatus Saccharibacteria bacterium]
MMNIVQLLASAEPAESQGIAALGLSPWAILAQGVTFLIFFLLVKKFALGKIVDTIETRRKTIEESLNKAEELNKQNEEAEKRVNSLLSEARKESEEIIKKSREEASAVITDAEKIAGEKAEKIIADGKLQIEAEVLKAREALKKETLGLVARATEAVLGEAVDSKKSESIIRKALEETK